MTANGEVIREVEELARLGGCVGNFAACSTSMVALLERIRQQTPQTGHRTATTPEEKRLFLLGAKALNYVAQSSLKAFGQTSPKLSIQKWTTPMLRKPVLSLGREIARLSYMHISMDILMALTQGDQTKLDPPSEIYRRTAGADDSTLDSGETLLQVASELFQLSSAARINTYSYAQGFQVVLPAIGNAGHNWNTEVFPYVERTLTALAHSHCVWFSCMASHFQVSLWGQPVPGTDVTKPRLYTGPAHATACTLHKAQATGRAFSMSQKQEQRWDLLRTELNRLSSSKVGMLEFQAMVTFKILHSAGAGRHNSDTHTANLALEVLDRKVREYFGIRTPLGAGLEAHQSGTDRVPKPDWRNSLNTRRWAILECLDFLFSRHGRDPSRLNAASSIVALGRGTNVNALVHQDHPDTVFILSVSAADWTQEWAEEMVGYIRLAIVGAAQFLSSEFEDADVKLGGEVVPRAKDCENWLRDRVGALED